MKWTPRKTGFEQRWAPGWGWIIGRDPGNGVLALLGSPLLLISLTPTPLPPRPTWSRAEWLWPQRRSISSPLLISKAHYFVLCLALSQKQLEGLVLTDCHFLPSFPPRPLWPFTRTIIYFGEFLGYCFVRANQWWVTNDPSGVALAWALLSSLLLCPWVTHVARFIFKSFITIAFVLVFWKTEKRGVKKKQKGYVLARTYRCQR